MALSFSGLERLEEGQRGIEGFFASGTTSKFETSDSKLVIKPESKRSRSRSPKPPILEPNPSPKKPRLPTLRTGKQKTALDSFLAKNGGSSNGAHKLTTSLGLCAPTSLEGSKSTEVAVVPIDSPLTDDPIIMSSDRWTCPKCGSVFTSDNDAVQGSETQSVQFQRREHEDYHFAMELQDNDGARHRLKSVVKVKKKGQRNPEGIKAFFSSKAAKAEPP